MRRAISEYGIARERVLGLGVGIAAPVDAGGALSAEGIMPGWTGIRPGTPDTSHATVAPPQREKKPHTRRDRPSRSARRIGPVMARLTARAVSLMSR